jgi:S-adenosylmethionine:tRNA ribosyltransferase-isomerase
MPIPDTVSAQADDFDYDLPPSSIAQHPVEPRDAARLLVDRGDRIDHHRVADLDRLLEPGDLLVVNDTRVLAARLALAKTTGGKAEVLLLEPTATPNRWQALVRPGRRLPPGTVLVAAADDADGAPPGTPLVTVGEPVDGAGDGRRFVDLADGAMDQVGQVPLPPYITASLDDPERYQTVFADRPGSVAAPTAGLHLTEALLDRLAERGVEVARVELRVGLGTFRPLSTERVADHRMHAEAYRVEPEVWERVQAAPRVVAVGTTVVRTLESVAATGVLEGDTDLFIRRGHRWRAVDVLLTNFHVPRSSLLVMIDALIGDRWRDLYRVAIDDGYRFLSFGDAMLLDPMLLDPTPGATDRAPREEH